MTTWEGFWDAMYQLRNPRLPRLLEDGRCGDGVGAGASRRCARRARFPLAARASDRRSRSGIPAIGRCGRLEADCMYAAHDRTRRPLTSRIEHPFLLPPAHLVRPAARFLEGCSLEQANYTRQRHHRCGLPLLASRHGCEEVALEGYRVTLAGNNVFAGRVRVRYRRDASKGVLGTGDGVIPPLASRRWARGKETIGFRFSYLL